MIDRRGDYRRRECTVCENRFSTREMVVVRSKQREMKPIAAVPKFRKKPAPMPAPTSEPTTTKPLTVPRDIPHPSYYKPPSDKPISAHNARERLEWLREERELRALDNEGI